MRFILQEIISRKIVDRDLEVVGPKVTRNLSGPCEIECTVPYQGPNRGQPIIKPYKHFIHVEEEFPTPTGRENRIIATGIVQPSEMEDNGDLKIKATGFSAYGKGIPWLQDWNPITVDPFHAFQKVWTHLQSFPQGNMNIQIYPADSGTFMLPGWSFNGIELDVQFFAIFQRAADMRDCDDFLNNLARDIPFDFIEESKWNANHTDVDLKIKLGYPRLGANQEAMVFRQAENAIQMKPKTETEIQWASDIIVKGWFPGKMYSSQFSNPATDRLRRVVKEGDMNINSKERAAVWAKRKLTRRQVPDHWEGLVADAGHPNAPFGQWDVGDDIAVEGFIPWAANNGRVKLAHKVMAYQWDGSGKVQLALKAAGAFNYDPIEYQSGNGGFLGGLLGGLL